MSAVDDMLEGDEMLLKQIAFSEGPMAADQYMRLFNNACMQMAMFEDVSLELAQKMKTSGVGFFAPYVSLSTHMEH